MFNRTAEYVAHGSRALSPALHKLDPEQRLRLAKSSQKISKVLGEMPVIDVIPASPEAEHASIASLCHPGAETNQWGLKRKRAGRIGRKAPPPAPVLRYKLPITQYLDPTPSANTPQEPSRRPRKAIPNALDLVSPVRRTDASPFSPFRYSYLK